MPSRRTSPGAAPSRERLLAAAKRLFAAQGYEQTATSAIARDARTSESQLMRYFGGKIGLLDALFDDAWRDLNTQVRELMTAEVDSPRALLDVVALIVDVLTKDADLATLLLFEGRRVRGGKGRIRMSAGYVAFTDAIRELVRRGQEAGTIDRALDAGAITSGIIGAVEGMVRDRKLASRARGRTFAERDVHMIVQGMVAGFAPDASRPRTRRR